MKNIVVISLLLMGLYYPGRAQLSVNSQIIEFHTLVRTKIPDIILSETADDGFAPATTGTHILQLVLTEDNVIFNPLARVTATKTRGTDITSVTASVAYDTITLTFDFTTTAASRDVITISGIEVQYDRTDNASVSIRRTSVGRSTLPTNGLSDSDDIVRMQRDNTDPREVSAEREPLRGSTSASKYTDLKIKFLEPVLISTAKSTANDDRIQIRRQSDDHPIVDYKRDTSRITISSDSTVTISFDQSLINFGDNIYVWMGNKVIVDRSNRAFGGYTGNSDWEISIRNRMVKAPSIDQNTRLLICPNISNKIPPFTFYEIESEDFSIPSGSNSASIFLGLNDGNTTFNPAATNRITTSLSASTDIQSVRVSAVTRTRLTLEVQFKSNIGTHVVDSITIVGIEVNYEGTSQGTNVNLVKTGGTLSMYGMKNNATVFSILRTSALTSTPTVTGDRTHCVGASVANQILTVSSTEAGVSYKWYDNQTPSYGTSGNPSLNDLSIATGATDAGDYTRYLISTVQNKCPSIPVEVTISISAPPTVTLSSPTLCYGAETSISATVTPSTGSYSYSWTWNVGNPSASTYATPQLQITSALSTHTEQSTASIPYSVAVTDTESECVKSEAGTVTIRERVKLVSPTARRFSSSDDKQTLTASVLGGIFRGIGIVQKTISDYEFDPKAAYDILSTSGAGNSKIDVYYQVTDQATLCSTPNNYIIDSLFILDSYLVRGSLASQYCVDEHPTTFQSNSELHDREVNNRKFRLQYSAPAYRQIMEEVKSLNQYENRKDRLEKALLETVTVYNSASMYETGDYVYWTPPGGNRTLYRSRVNGNMGNEPPAPSPPPNPPNPPNPSASSLHWIEKRAIVPEYSSLDIYMIGDYVYWGLGNNRELYRAIRDQDPQNTGSPNSSAHWKPGIMKVKFDGEIRNINERFFKNGVPSAGEATVVRRDTTYTRSFENTSKTLNFYELLTRENPECARCPSDKKNKIELGVYLAYVNGEDIAMHNVGRIGEQYPYRAIVYTGSTFYQNQSSTGTSLVYDAHPPSTNAGWTSISNTFDNGSMYRRGDGQQPVSWVSGFVYLREAAISINTAKKANFTGFNASDTLCQNGSSVVLLGTDNSEGGVGTYTAGATNTGEGLPNSVISQNAQNNKWELSLSEAYTRGSIQGQAQGSFTKSVYVKYSYSVASIRGSSGSCSDDTIRLVYINKTPTTPVIALDPLSPKLSPNNFPVYCHSNSRVNLSLSNRVQIEADAEKPIAINYSGTEELEEDDDESSNQFTPAEVIKDLNAKRSDLITYTTRPTVTITATVTDKNGCAHSGTTNVIINPEVAASLRDEDNIKKVFCNNDQVATIKGNQTDSFFEVYDDESAGNEYTTLRAGSLGNGEDSLKVNPTVWYNAYTAANSDVDRSNYRPQRFKVVYSTFDADECEQEGSEFLITIGNPPSKPVTITRYNPQNKPNRRCSNEEVDSIVVKPRGGLLTITRASKRINGQDILPVTFLNANARSNKADTLYKFNPRDILTNARVIDNSQDDEGGTYSFKYEYQQIVGNRTCRTIVELSQALNIHSSPTASFDVPVKCDGNVIRFQANREENRNQAASYKWYIDGGNPINGHRSEEITLSKRTPPEVKLVVSYPAIDGHKACKDSVTKTQQVGPVPKIDFSVSKLCLNDDTRFVYDDSESEIPVNTLSWKFGKNGTPRPYSSIQDAGTVINRFALGDHRVTLRAKISEDRGGCEDEISKTITILPYVTSSIINPSNPYSMKELDNGRGYWTVQNVNGTGWTYGAPTGSRIQDTGPVWRIQTTENVGYGASINSYLNSPCMDLSAFQNPQIFLDYWKDTRSSDGAVFQYSTDGGATWNVLGTTSANSGIQWHDASGILSNPGGQSQSGWSGIGTGYVAGLHSLSGISNPQKMQFRLAFSSASSPLVTPYEGFAVRDFIVSNQDRLVLVENFTNADHDTNDANFELFKKKGVGESQDVIKLQYHMSYPNADSIHEVNTVDPLARSLFYGISSVPRGFLDGSTGASVYSFTESGSNSWYSQLFNQKTLYPVYLNMAISNVKIVERDLSTLGNKGLVLSGQVRLEKRSTFDMEITDYFLLVAVVENQVGRYTHVVRKLLPTSSGFNINELGTANHATYNFSWDISPSMVKNVKNLSVVAFVQKNKGNKEILQSARLMITNAPSNPSYTTGINSREPYWVEVYPNPAQDKISIQIHGDIHKETRVQFFDSTGRLVLSRTIQSGVNQSRIDISHFLGGVYMVHVHNEKGSKYKKIIVTK